MVNKELCQDCYWYLGYCQAKSTFDALVTQGKTPSDVKLFVESTPQFNACEVKSVFLSGIDDKGKQPLIGEEKIRGEDKKKLDKLEEQLAQIKSESNNRI